MSDVLKLLEMKKRDESQNSSESQSTCSEESNENLAPDGGWGWLVCLGSFVINFILDGTMFSFGVMLMSLLEYFDESKAKTSWIGSVLLGLSMILGKLQSMIFLAISIDSKVFLERYYLNVGIYLLLLYYYLLVILYLRTVILLHVCKFC